MRYKRSVLLSIATVFILCFCGIHYGNRFDMDNTDSSSSESVLVTQDYKRHRNPPEKKMVIILTYQRCGSSFLGNLFDRNPDAFYVYEPLDALYTAMYGTSEGWNVPSDITNLPNGSQRNLPPDEIEAVTEFQENLLTCNLEKLPSEFLTHKYWRLFQGFQTGLKNYSTCLKQNHLSNGCLKLLKGVCPFRFGDDKTKEASCARSLWLNKDLSGDSYPVGLLKYRNCTDDLHEKVITGCVSYLKAFCEDAGLTAIKTVRGTMQSVIPLMDKYPKLRIISLVRDPRSVVLSRMKLHSTRGIFSKNDTTREAELYCRTVLRDYRIIDSLPQHQSNRIFSLIYDDFVQEPLKYTEQIYRFIGVNLPQKTKSFMNKNTKVKKKTWKNIMTKAKISSINNVCSDFFERMSRNWDQIDSLKL